MDGMVTSAVAAARAPPQGSGQAVLPVDGNAGASAPPSTNRRTVARHRRYM